MKTVNIAPQTLPILLTTSQNNYKTSALLMQKITQILQSYSQNCTRLDQYYLQIESLISYNKKAIELLQKFQEHQDWLIKRLEKMEEINIQCMKEFCLVKGRDFVVPNPLQYKSMFREFNLLDVQLRSQMPQHPVVDMNYKEKLLDILKEYLENSDKGLSSAVEQIAQERSQSQLKQIKQIQRMIKEYNQKLVRGDNSDIFQLLRNKLEIRQKVQTIYDANKGNTSIKPNNQTQTKLCSNLISLHAKFEQIDENTLQQFLSKQKNVIEEIKAEQKIIQKRIQRQYSKIENECKDLSQKLKYIEISKVEMQIKYQELEIKANNKEVKFAEYMKEREKMIGVIEELEREVVNGGSFGHIESSTLLGILNKQKWPVQKQYFEVSIMNQLQKIEQQSQPIIRIIPPKNIQLHIPKDRAISSLILIQSGTQTLQSYQSQQKKIIQNKISSSYWETGRQKVQLCQKNQKIIELEQQIKSLSLLITSQKKEKEQHERMSLTISERLRKIQEQNKKEKSKLERKVAILTQENIKLQKNKKDIEELATGVYQALQLVSSMSFNQKIKQKVDKITHRLSEIMANYQKQTLWDIQKQVPGFFKTLSMQNMQASSNLIDNGSFIDELNHGHSLTNSNMKIIKQKVQKLHSIQPSESQHAKTSQIQQLSISLQKADKNKQQQQQRQQQRQQQQRQQQKQQQQRQYKEKINEQQNLYLDDYLSLRCLYKQALQSLDMQQLKTKKMQIEYQKYSQIVQNKQRINAVKFSLQKQVIFLTRIVVEQKQIIEEERKVYNQILKQYHESFKSKLYDQIFIIKNKINQGGNHNPSF